MFWGLVLRFQGLGFSIGTSRFRVWNLGFRLHLKYGGLYREEYQNGFGLGSDIILDNTEW